MMILIKNATIITQNDKRAVLNDTDIYIEGNKISKIGRELSPANCDEIIEARGMWVAPGFINAHVHLGESAYGPYIMGGYSLSEYLDRTEALVKNNQDIEEKRDIITKFSLLNIVKNGTTTICGGRISEASEYFGIRNVSGYMLMNSDKLKHLQDNFSVRLGGLISSGRSGLTTYALFVHSPRFVDETILKEAAIFLEANPSVRIMLHAAEEESSDDMAILKKYNLLGDRTILIHGNSFSGTDLDVIKLSSSHLIHCLTSNMKVDKTTLNISTAMERGCNVSIATDGVVSGADFSVLREAGNVYRYHNRFNRKETISAQKVFDMITLNPARALGLESDIGSLEVGKMADLVIFKPPFIASGQSPVEQLISYANLVQMSYVMISGEIIVKDFSVATKNSDSIESEFGKVVSGINV